MRPAIDPATVMNEAMARLNDGGVIVSCVDTQGRTNLITVSWWLFGWFYHERPMSVIAIRRDRYSHRFLESVPEFVVAVPTVGIREAVDICGSASGRDGDKFALAGLTPIPSYHVRAPSIGECPVNFECRVYETVHPPHRLLTPEHRARPLGQQHSIYFAEVLGVYAGSE